jgi:hypothetical protein
MPRAFFKNEFTKLSFQTGVKAIGSKNKDLRSHLEPEALLLLFRKTFKVFGNLKGLPLNV